MSRAESTRRLGDLRRRMPRHLLSALALLLLLLSCGRELGYTADGAPAKGIPLFAAGTTKVPKKVGDKNPTRDVSSFASPFLVGGSGVMVALAEAQYTGSGERDVDTVARYIETEGEDWATKATENIETNWKTQLILQGKTGVNHSVSMNPTAVIKGDKIYLLALNNTKPDDSTNNGNSWHLVLAVGAITGQVGSKNIEWNQSESLHSKLTQEIENMHLSVFPGSDHSAFLRSNGAIVFSASATNREGTSGFAIMQLKDDKEQWEVSFAERPKGCRVFSLFEWKKKLIHVFFGCSTDTRHAKEYDEAKREWKDADDTFLHLLSVGVISPDLTPVTFGNKSSLLFTGECCLKNSDSRRYLPFFYTDGIRTEAFGRSIDIGYPNIVSRRLLYTNDELFLMYQGAGKGLENIVFTRLNRPLKIIKSTLNTWAKNDAYLSKPCNETAPEGASSDTPCVTPMPTAALVGFLSNKGDATRWTDEYNLWTVWLKGTKVKTGYMFSEAYEGVWWPLLGIYPSKQDEFMKYGLTVVATVTVHKTPKNDAPLLTVGEKGLNERFGLWCVDGKWKVITKIGGTEPDAGLVTNTTYKVALVVKNNKISAYVNGIFLGDPLPITAPGTGRFDVRDVFIGGYEHASWMHITVTNVFLYNRVLSDTELEAASKTVPPIKRKDLNEKFETSTDSEKATERQTAPEKTSETPTDSEKATKTPTNPEDSSVSVRMGVTPLFLLGFFCLAVFW